MSFKDTTSASRPQVPTPSRAASSSSLKNIYLTLYNFGSAVAWATILARTGMIARKEGFGAKGGWFGKKEGAVYAGVGEFVKVTQTVALAEVLHSLFGIVRAPVFTTVMQVASRVILVWGIVNEFPAETSTSVAYTTMLVAWSATEVVRYSYFVFFLNGAVPGVLQWLRYNGFFLLYPMGISSEMWLVWKSVKPAAKKDEKLPWLLYGVLGLYVPGAYILYTHMMAQRRRIMRGKSKAT